MNPLHGPIKIGPENVLLTNGAIGANFLVYYTLVGPGDHVIVVDPAYQQLNSVPKMFGGNVELLKLRPENQNLPDPQQLRGMIKKGKTKLININTPHNPTGSVIPESMMKEIVEIARDAGAYLLSDEVYRPMYLELTGGEQHHPSSAASLYEKAIATGSTSKAFAMAGLRLGWVISPDKTVMEQCMAKRDYNTISIGIIDDMIATWALTGRKALLEYNRNLCEKNLAIFDKFVKDSNGAVSYVKPKGGTVTFLKVEGVRDTLSFTDEFIKEHKTLVVPGETFGSPGYLRIGFANNTEDLIKGLDNLKQFITKHNFVPAGWSKWNE